MFRHRLKFLCALSWGLSLAFAQTGQEKPGPVQPIPFSHKIHVSGAKLACSDCHVSPEKFGDPVSIPDAPKCLECHAYSASQTPTLATLNAFVEKKQPIPWVRVFKLRDFVFFDHRYHLMNGIQCEDCHGPIGTEDVVSNRLNTTNMEFCQACHVKTRAATGCNTCHNTQ